MMLLALSTGSLYFLALRLRLFFVGQRKVIVWAYDDCDDGDNNDKVYSSDGWTDGYICDGGGCCA